MDIEPSYRLVREQDGLTHHSRHIGWIEWNEDGTFKAQHDEPAIGRSCMLDPHRMQFTWLTTKVTEIVDQKDDYVKFNTLNSTYELWKV